MIAECDGCWWNDKVRSSGCIGGNAGAKLMAGIYRIEYAAIASQGIYNGVSSMYTVYVLPDL